MCLCARVSGTGVSSLGGWAAGRRQAQARCTWSVSGSWPGPGSRPVSPHTHRLMPPALASSEETAASAASVVTRDKSDQSDTSDGMIQSAWGAWCSVKTNYYSCVSWPVQCQSQAVNTLKQVMTEAHDASLIVHYGCLLDMKVASMFCLGHGRKRTQLPLSDSILLNQRDEKPKASGELPVKLPKKDWISEILNGQQQAWL